MHTPPISAGPILTSSLFNEPMRVASVQANGPASWVAWYDHLLQLAHPQLPADAARPCGGSHPGQHSNAGRLEP